MKYNSMQEYLKEAFSKYREKVAIEYDCKTYSYRELDEKSGSVASFIIAQGIKKGSFIGVLLRDKAELIIAIIGILKAGCAFVPLDHTYPVKRLYSMIKSVGMEHIIVDAENTSLLQILSVESNKDFKAITINDGFYKQQVWEELNLSYEPDDSIYVYYTSGTTGEPKAIIGRNKSLAHFIEWEIDTFDIYEGFRISQFTSQCHDPYLRDIFVPLFAGGIICIPSDKETIIETKRMIEWIEHSEVNLIHCTPSLFKVFNTDSLTDGNLKELKYILLAGEKVSPASLENWYKVFGNKICLVNMYGPTETTLAKLYYPIKPEDVKRNSIPIGKPIRGARVIILDENMKICNKGIGGEIYIRTPYRTLGYYNNPELTGEKFIQNPFGDNADDIIYKTGDLGRFLDDDNIEFLGRADRQVKIRGFRIELSDIENTLLKHEQIKEAVVNHEENSNGDIKLHLYIVLKNQDKEKETELIYSIEAYLNERLQDYMLPNSITAIEKIPLTANGKVDYSTLPAPIKNVVKEFVGPSNAIEEKLAEIWCELLDCDNASTNVSFLKAGGHSLNAMNLIARVHQEFEVELPLGEIFERGTIKELALYVKNALSSTYQTIRPVEKRQNYPVSSAQKRMYVVNELISGKTTYNMPVVILMEGAFDKDIFEGAVQKLINRQESFRTSFKMVDGEVVQEIQDDMDFHVEYMEAGDDKIEQIKKSFIRPFDIGKAPLLRVGLAKAGQERYYLMFDMHHIISDGISLGIFTRELLELCKGKHLKELEVKYRDFAVWQREIYSEQALKEQEKYWLKQLEGELPVLNLQLDYPRLPQRSFEGEKVGIDIGSDTIRRLKNTAAQNGVTLYMLLLASYYILLYKYTGQEDIIIGSPVAGRSHVQLKEVIGMFVNTIILRNYPSAEKTFAEFLKEIKENVLNSFENQDYQFEELISKLDLNRDMSRNPIFDTMFVLENTDRSEIEMDGLKITEYPNGWDISKYDLTLRGLECKDRIRIEFEYCTALFKKETIERLLKHYINILSEVCDGVSAKIKHIDVLTQEEKNKLLYIFNDTHAGYPNRKTIHKLFEEQAERFPDNIAVVFNDSSITYKELNEKSNQLGARLRKEGVTRDSIVGIALAPSIEMIIGMVGILKAGGAYLPINPEYPVDRIKFMLNDSGANILLTQGKLENLDVMVVDLTDSSLYTGDNSNPENINSTDDLAYIIYTSGSTGKPKGVMVEHRNVVRLMKNDRFQFDFSECDVWTMFHSFAFDFSVWEMYGALLYGGKLVMVPKPVAKDTGKYLKLLKKEQVTVLNQTPTAFYNLMNEEIACRDKELKIRYAIFGGEALKPALLKEWRKKYPGIKLINMYGITETTVHVTFKEITEYEIEHNISNIGRPIPTLTTYIMDRELKLLPIGAAGELCVGGDGVARGYLNRKELTLEKFEQNPYKPDERIYRSGDLVKLLPDGEMEYLGRIDHQVKIRGFRIELGEIETRLLKHSLIKEVIVVAKDDQQGNKYLCAYFTASDEVNTGELREYLLSELPEYMAPAYFVQIDKMPLTANGKVNTKELPEPQIHIKSGEEYEAPRNEIERLLVEALKEVLGVGKISIRDNFFLLGGDSIKALQVSARMQKNMYSLKVDDLFRYPVIKELSGFVKPLIKKAAQGIINGNIQLTPIQAWFFKHKFENMNHWNQSVMLYNADGFDEEAVERSFQSIILHHDALRMVFGTDGQAVIQYNRGLEGELYSFEVYNYTEELDYEAKIINTANKIQAGINLEEGPLTKIAIFKTGNGDHLLIVIHHLVIDGVSWRILLEDLMGAYGEALTGKGIVLQDKTDSYKVWSEHLKEYAEGQELQQEISYWCNIENTDIKPLPKDFHIQGDLIRDRKNKVIKLSREETISLLMEVNHAYNTEIMDILLTALGLSIHQWTGENKILINLEGHGRESIIEAVDITRTIGWFTTCYPFVIDLSKYDSLAGQIKSIKEDIRHIPNKGIGYGILKYLTCEERKGMEFRLEPEISFNYLGQFGQDSKNQTFKLSSISSGNTVSKQSKALFALEITGIIKDECFELTLNYNMNLYKAETISRLAQSLIDNIRAIIAHCSQKQATELTPYDVGYKDLSFEELENIMDIAQDL